MRIFNPDRSINNETAILANFGETSPLFRRALRELACRDAELAKRYENACNFQWATTDYYSDGSEKLALEALKLASAAGLSCYIQTDPRGASIYVAKGEALNGDNYSSRGTALFYGEA